MAHSYARQVVVAVVFLSCVSSKSECPKIKEMKTASFLSPGPGNWHSVTSALFCWAGSYRAEIPGKWVWTHLSMGGLLKEFRGPVSQQSPMNTPSAN